MHISSLFIKRPVMTTLVMLAILIFGVASYRKLPVSDLPTVDFPTISVSADLRGASPETMASAVATPLERQLSTIAGLDSMSSTNTLGSTRITLQFNLSRDIDGAAQDVQSMISKAAHQLPQDMSEPPSYQKVNPADQPVLFIAISSPTLPLSQVSEYADTLMAQRISMVPGVAQVQVYGSKKYAVRIQLDPYALASRGIGINEISSAIQTGNVQQPTGTLYGKFKAFTINTQGQLLDVESYRLLIIAYRNGAPVRLQDVGKVTDDVENNKSANWYKNTLAMVLAIQRQPGTNTVQVVDSIKTLLPTFRSQIPASVDLDILYDRSVPIRESVNDVKFTLSLALILVVLVIFLFLRNIRATVIPGLALPMSLIGTFIVMYALGYSIDTLSLMAMTLSVGFVVDDAIVMLENIIRHSERGEGVYDAAMKGSKEIGFTILSMTLSLVAVFIPVMFMGGILGRLLREFAVTISVAILMSGFISLSLTPMLGSRFLKPQEKIKHGGAYWKMERFFDGMRRVYEKSLRAVLKYRRTTLVGSFVVLLATFYLFTKVPMGFLPSVDMGQIFASTEAQQGISFESMVEHQQQLAKIVAADPNIEAFMSNVGSGAGNTGRFNIRLKPRKERKLDADQIIQQLRPKLAKVPGIQIFLQNPPIINIGGRMSKSLYQYTLQSPDINELYSYATSLQSKMSSMPELQDVTSDLQITNPEVEIEIKRDAASALGVTAKDVEDALYSAYGSRQVSTIYAANNQYKVIMELDPKYQTDPTKLSMLYIRTSKGYFSPLSYLADIKKGVGPLSVNHSGQLPSVTISFNLKPGVALGEAVTAIEKLSLETLPKTISTSFQGTAQAFKSSMKGLWMLLILAILVIYIVLGILYESFIHPLTILSGLPSAAVGALITLLLFGKSLDVYAFVGVIMLVGIVKKNAIMMIDFAIEAQKGGKTALDAIFEGCMTRFRPIMMTTMSALMGSLPIALGIGTSSDAYRPLGLAVVGGLMFSQLLTLYITPVIYYYMDKIQSRKKVAAGNGYEK